MGFAMAIIEGSQSDLQGHQMQEFCKHLTITGSTSSLDQLSRSFTLSTQSLLRCVVFFMGFPEYLKLMQYVVDCQEQQQTLITQYESDKKECEKVERGLRMEVASLKNEVEVYAEKLKTVSRENSLSMRFLV